MTRAISKEAMFPPILENFPRFKPMWDQFQKDWDEEADKPYYILLGNLAQLVVEDLSSGDMESCESVLRVAEDWLVHGEAYVKEAAATGFLEGIQNIAGNQGVDTTPILTLLGPESKKRWNQLNQYWNGDPRAPHE